MTKALNRTCLMALVATLGCGDDSTPATDAGPGMVDTGPGMMDAGPPIMNACTNAADMMAVITRMDYGTGMDQTYGDVVTDCATDCYLAGMTTEPAFSTCTRMCVNEGTMMSASNSCRDCYVFRAICAASNCAIPCLGDPADCDMCQCENDCVSAFETCTGFSTMTCGGADAGMPADAGTDAGGA